MQLLTAMSLGVLLKMKIEDRKGFQMAINTVVAFALVLFALSLVAVFLFSNFGPLGEPTQEAAGETGGRANRSNLTEKFFSMGHEGECEGGTQSVTCTDYYQAKGYMKKGLGDEEPISECSIIGGYPADTWGKVDMKCAYWPKNCTPRQGYSREIVHLKTLDYRGIGTCVHRKNRPHWFTETPRCTYYWRGEPKTKKNC